MAVAPSLRCLTIQRLTQYIGPMDEFEPVPFPEEALPALTALTSLQLADSMDNSINLSGLVALRDLVLQSDGGLFIHADDLPASRNLTRLVLHNLITYSGRYTGPTMHAAALCRVPELQHLVLHSHMEADQVCGTAGFLRELGSLTQLTLLRVQQGPLEQPVEPAAYASLTASSALHTLAINEAHLPDGAWAHVFGHGRQLPQLRSLRLHKCTD